MTSKVMSSQDKTEGLEAGFEPRCDVVPICWRGIRVCEVLFTGITQPSVAPSVAPTQSLLTDRAVQYIGHCPH